MASTCLHPGCDYPDQDHRPYARLRDGIPSVSTIASTLDVGDKSRAFSWSASLIAADMGVHHSDKWWNMANHPCGHEAKNLCQACRYVRSEFDRRWKAKAALGSHVHHLALSWARGEDIYVDDGAKPYLDALELFYLDHDPQFLALEQTVRYAGDGHLDYRGQLDFVAELSYGRDSRVGLWDIKTGGFWPLEQTLQLAGYRYASYMTTWEGRQEMRGHSVPVVDEAGVLMLHDTGSYELIPLPADYDAFGVFLGLRGAWNWGKGIGEWDRARKQAVTVPERQEDDPF